MQRFLKNDLVKGLQKIKFEKDNIYDTCQMGKQTQISFKSINMLNTTRPLQLLHMNLFGPFRTLNVGRKQYVLVIIDDYSRFTWTFFLAHKDEIIDFFSQNFVERFKMKGDTQSSQLESIMEKNLISNFLKYFVMKMIWIIIF